MAVAGYYLVAHGIDYVAWPRLQPLTDTINYSGKGFFSGQHGRGFAASGGRKVGGKHKQLMTIQHGGNSNEKGDADMEMAHSSVPVSNSVPSNPSTTVGKKRVD